jgi:hypothetical protein
MMNLPEWASLHHHRVQDRVRKFLPKISSKDSPYRLKKKQGEMTPVPAEAGKNLKNAVGKQVDKIL